MANYTYVTLGTFGRVKIPLVEKEEFDRKECKEHKIRSGERHRYKEYKYCPMCAKELETVMKKVMRPSIHVDAYEVTDGAMIDRNEPYFDGRSVELVWIVGNLSNRPGTDSKRETRDGSFEFIEITNGEKVREFWKAYRKEFNLLNEAYGDIVIDIVYGQLTWSEW